MDLHLQNALRDLLLHEFDKTELQGFFYNLPLEIDDLTHFSRQQLAAELLRLLDNQGRLAELWPLAQSLRPAYDWQALGEGRQSVPVWVRGQQFGRRYGVWLGLASGVLLIVVLWGVFGQGGNMSTLGDCAPIVGGNIEGSQISINCDKK